MTTTAPVPQRIQPFPPAPAGFVACRVMLPGAMLTHLVALDEHGSNGGRPTVCGLTRFDDRDEFGRAIAGTAQLPGWGMGDSGVQGPSVEQRRCDDCYRQAAGRKRRMASADEGRFRAMVAEGITDGAIAKHFGVNVKTIERWRKARGLASQWRPTRSVRHGTASYYSEGCRCDACTEAHRVKVRDRRARRAAHTRTHGLPAHIKHGINAYVNWGCLCPICRAAAVDRNRRDLERRKAQQHSTITPTGAHR